MNWLFKGGTLVTLDPPMVEPGDLRVAGGRIAERGAGLAAGADEEVIEVGGRILMPGMVCAHTHLYSSLARGMPAPPRAPDNFREVLELIWWRLDRALDEEAIYWSALVGALEAARSGTTCLFDHHASPAHIAGSLRVVGEALGRVGLRAALCYEVTNRGGAEERDAGLEENRAWLADRSRPGLLRGMVGAHASFTLTDASIEVCAELMREFDAGLHIHAAEDRCDVEDAREKYGLGVVERLAGRGALNAHTILAHGTHLDAREIAMAREAGAWLAHNPRSNMNNRVGYAPVETFGEKITLGTDGLGGDMFEEGRAAFFKGREAGLGGGADQWRRALANNQRLASQIFGEEIGTLNPGAAADLVVLDYQAPTPLAAGNLAAHLIFGFNSAAVESVLVGGRFVIRDRRPALDVAEVYRPAREASAKLWARMREI